MALIENKKILDIVFEDIEKIIKGLEDCAELGYYVNDEIFYIDKINNLLKTLKL